MLGLRQIRSVFVWALFERLSDRTHDWQDAHLYRGVSLFRVRMSLRAAMRELVQ